MIHVLVCTHQRKNPQKPLGNGASPAHLLSPPWFVHTPLPKNTPCAAGDPSSVRNYVPPRSNFDRHRHARKAPSRCAAEGGSCECWCHDVSTSDRELPCVFGDVVGVYRRRWQLYSFSACSRRRWSREHWRREQDCKKTFHVVAFSRVGVVYARSSLLRPFALG